MRITIFFLFIGFYLNGQHSLYMPSGAKAVEGGGLFAPSSPSMVGIWAAYNGPFRAELSVDKFTSSFSGATIFGARVDVPLLKQNQKLPINLLADLGFQRFSGSGFSSNAYSGAGIISHQIRNDRTVISPYGSVGYIKFEGGGDLKWSVGVDVLVNRFLLSLDHERIGGGGTTYLRFGYRFGNNQNGNDFSSSDRTELPEPGDNLKDQEARDTERLQQELAEADSLNRELAQEERMQQSQEAERLRQAEAERQQLETARLEQERIDQEKAEEIARQQAEMERLRKEQESMLNRNRNEVEQKAQQQNQAEEVQDARPLESENAADSNSQHQESKAETISSGPLFTVQFFASKYSNKSFDNLSWLPSILIEKAEGKELYRYKTGYFGSRYEAERVASQLKASGYPGAFVKEEK